MDAILEFIAPGVNFIQYHGQIIVSVACGLIAAAGVGVK
jgi:hypothetical protein